MVGKTCSFLIYLIFLITFSGSVFPQDIAKIKLVKISSEEENKIVNSINELIKKMRNEKWAEVYDLLLRNSVDGDEAKKEFIKKMEEDSKDSSSYFVTDFKVSKDGILVFDDEKMFEEINVSGCIEVKIKGVKHKYIGTVSLGRTKKNDWLFHSLPIINPDSRAGGPIQCCE